MINKKLLLLGVLIALCGVLCCGFVTAGELDNSTHVEPLSVEEESSSEPLSVDEEASAEPLSADNGSSSEPLNADNGTIAEPLSLDNEVSVEPLSTVNKAYAKLSSVDGGLPTTTATEYRIVTYKEKVFSHYKKYTKKFICVMEGKSVKTVKKFFSHRMTYGDDECCRYSVGKVVRAWYYNDNAYNWKIYKVKKISKKRYSAQAGGKTAKYKLYVKLYYKKPVYKTVTYKEKVPVY